MGFSMRIRTDYHFDNPTDDESEDKLISDGYITSDKSFYSIVLYNGSNKNCKISVYYNDELIHSIDNMRPYKELTLSTDLHGNRLQFKKDYLNASLNNLSQIVAIFTPILPLKTSQHSIIITIPILINNPATIKNSTLVSDRTVNYMIECCINAVKIMSDNFNNDI